MIEAEETSITVKTRGKCPNFSMYLKEHYYRPDEHSEGYFGKVVIDVVHHRGNVTTIEDMKNMAAAWNEANHFAGLLSAGTDQSLGSFEARWILVPYDEVMSQSNTKKSTTVEKKSPTRKKTTTKTERTTNKSQ